jgi:DNA ligase-1
LVVEVAFTDIQESPHFPGGLTLRFARIEGYRPDKRAAEADSFAAVPEPYRRTTGREAATRRPTRQQDGSRASSPAVLPSPV